MSSVKPIKAPALITTPVVMPQNRWAEEMADLEDHITDKVNPPSELIAEIILTWGDETKLVEVFNLDPHKFIHELRERLYKFMRNNRGSI